MDDEKLRELERNSSWYKKLEKLFREDDVFWNNEIAANLFVSICLLVLAGVLVLSFFLAYVGVFDVPIDRMAKVLIVNIPLLIFGNYISAKYRGQKHWIKYVLCFISICASIGLCSAISIFVPIITCIPIVLSCRYYSRKFTNTVYSFTVLGMAISELMYSRFGMVDLNLVSIPEGSVLKIVGDSGLRGAVMVTDYDYGTYLANLFRGSFMPRFLLVSIVAFICQELARRAHEMVLSQAEISKRTEGIKAELDMATNIQAAVLPKIFPAFPTRPDLKIKATMDPAKEVGGDFYDYYLIDDDHLLLAIADVSGKGIPAALFMMISKSLVKSSAYVYKSPAQIAQAVNRQLCDGNESDMFVTAWIGILEISTGIITAVDAGHEYPIIRHKGGEYELIKDKKSFVLAGMEDSIFREYTFDFKRGDYLFLYTDGVVEATNSSNELYGTARLLDALNRYKADEPEVILDHVRADVDAFVKDAPQFDDLTMLSMHFMEI